MLKITGVIFLKNDKSEIRSKGVNGQPEDSFEQINKYGTYNIQPTADTDNKLPAIAQGLPKMKIKNKDILKDKRK